MNHSIVVGANTVTLNVKYITFNTKAITVTSDGASATADTTTAANYNIYPIIRDKVYTAAIEIGDLTPLITAGAWVTTSSPPTFISNSAKLRPLIIKDATNPLTVIAESTLALSLPVVVSTDKLTFTFDSSANAPDYDTIGRFEFQFSYKAFGAALTETKAGSVWSIWTGTNYHNIETETPSEKLNGAYFVKIGNPDLSDLASGTVIFGY